ncbi:Patellin-3 [Dionaea muscipula]
MADEADRTSLSLEQMLALTHVPDPNNHPTPPPANNNGPITFSAATMLDGDGAGAGFLPEHERNALNELKLLVRLALNNRTLLTPPTPHQDNEAESVKDVGDKAENVTTITATTTTTTKLIAVDEDGAKTVQSMEETVVPIAPPQDLVPPPATKVAEEVSIWGIPVLKDERSDVILWKFLRARDFKVSEAFAMLKNTIRWRKEFGIEELMEEEEVYDEELEKVVFMRGVSREGNPVCYNAYGEFQSKEVYQKVLGDEAKRQRFLRWRIRFLEKSIRELDFRPGGVSTIVQVNDLRDSPGLGKWELRATTKQALQLLQDNYPEFVAKQVFINVPWWYIAANKMISPFLTQRTKSKFVFAGLSRSPQTLFEYVAPEQVPVPQGGLMSSADGDFSPEDAATQISIKPGSKQALEFSFTEACHLSWELRVLGWEVSYGAEFVPCSSAEAEEDAYTVIIHKVRKFSAAEISIIRGSFKITEPGKVLLSIHNPTSRRKLLLYRLKTQLIY